MVLDAFGASETGANGAVDMTEKGPRFRMNEWTTVITEDGKPAPVGEVGLLARRGHVPVGYYKDAQKTAATFVEFDGVRWAIPGDRAVIEDDGTITVLGRGLAVHQHGRREGLPRRGRGGPQEPSRRVRRDRRRRPRRALRRSRRRRRRAPSGPDARRSTSSRGHARTALAGYKMPKRLVLVDEVARTPAGKPNYRWAKELATTS